MGGLTVAAVLLNALLPLLMYPFAKTTWLAFDLLMHGMDAIDRAHGDGHAERPGSTA